MSADRFRRATDKIGKIAHQSTGVADLWRQSSDVLAATVPFFWTPCCYTLDPASLLVTSHFHDGMPTFPPELLAEEYYGDDVHRLITVAASPDRTLHFVRCDGRAAADQRPVAAEHDDVGDQELILRLRTRDGAVWGMLGLNREPDSTLFSAEEKAFLVGVAPALAEGVRRTLLIGEAAEPDYPDAPGLLIIDQGWQVRSRTPGTTDGWPKSRVMVDRGYPHRCSRSPVGRCGPRPPPSRTAWQQPGSGAAVGAGWCCTAPASTTTRSAASRSSSRPHTQRGSIRCSWPPTS